MPRRAEPGSTVAIVGAGISGLAAARALREAGVAVTLFDKGRWVAGRLSTRRSSGGLVFDHGAQYFTVRDPRFRSQVSEWMEQGVAAEWTGRIGALANGRLVESERSTPRFVGVPGMSQLCVPVAADLEVRGPVVVGAAECTASGCKLKDSAGEELGVFDFLIVTAPAPQAAGLLNSAPRLQQQAASVRMAPCWAVMVAFEEPLDLGFDGAFVEDSSLSWIDRNNSKPGRPPSPENWVLHASGEWTARNVECDPERVQADLLQAFWQSTQATVRRPAFVASHRWRFALPLEPLKDSFLLDPDLPVAACGDWCGGPRVEGAYLSGLCLAERLLARGPLESL